MILSSAPGRVNILGNPTDGLEGSYAVITSAISLRAFVKIGEGETVPLNESIRKLFIETLNVTKDYFPELTSILERPLRIEYHTKIPPESGLAGSTALIAAFLGGLRSYYSLNQRKLNDYILAEVIQRGEERAGVVCGYADRYASVMGGIAYIDFRGKLYHRPLYKEPLATYERLDKYISYIPLLIAYLGIPRSSGEVHKKFRTAYMKEMRLFKKGKVKKSRILKAMLKVGFTAIKGKYALLEENWEEFGKLMNENHKWVNYAMKLAGFKYGAGYYNNAIINFSLKNGALGAKLSGAGEGGSVLILVEAEKEERFKKKIEKYMKSIGLHNSKVFKYELSREGIIVKN